MVSPLWTDIFYAAHNFVSARNRKQSFLNDIGGWGQDKIGDTIIVPLADVSFGVAAGASVENNKNNAHHIFIVDDLKNLKHSGRISTIAALLGMVMQLKPILELNNDGKIALLGKALGRKKAMAEIKKVIVNLIQ